MLCLFPGLFACASVAPAEVTVKPSEPYRLWYRPQYARANPELYNHVSFVCSGGLDDAHFWNPRGVAVGRWAFGPQSPYSGGRWEYYKGQCNPVSDKWKFAAVGIDEWTPTGKKDFEICAQGLREARKEWPELFILVYTNGTDDILTELAKDGTVDLLVIEGYTYAPGYGGIGIDGIINRCNNHKPLFPK